VQCGRVTGGADASDDGVVVASLEDKKNALRPRSDRAPGTCAWLKSTMPAKCCRGRVVVGSAHQHKNALREGAPRAP